MAANIILPNINLIKLHEVKSILVNNIAKLYEFHINEYNINRNRVDIEIDIINENFNTDLERLIESCDELLEDEQLTQDYYPGQIILNKIQELINLTLNQENYQEEIMRIMNMYLATDANGQEINIAQDNNEESARFRALKFISIQRLSDIFYNIYMEDNSFFDEKN